MHRPLKRLLAILVAVPAAATAGEIRVEVRDPKGAPVADAVASLTPLDAAPAVQPPAEPVAVLQEGEEFRPHVTPVVVGTRVTFPNRDAVQHHVFSVSRAKKFDLPLYRGEPREPVLFDQPGVVSLGCNIHDWMSAYIVVLATPHFARSGDDGVALIIVVPPGRHRLEVWHPRVKATLTREVTVEGAGSATQVIALTLGVDRRVRRAPEAAGSGYK
jgi:plastocyanin